MRRIQMRPSWKLTLFSSQSCWHQMSRTSSKSISKMLRAAHYNLNLVEGIWTFQSITIEKHFNRTPIISTTGGNARKAFAWKPFSVNWSRNYSILLSSLNLHYFPREPHSFKSSYKLLVAWFLGNYCIMLLYIVLGIYTILQIRFNSSCDS